MMARLIYRCTACSTRRLSSRLCRKYSLLDRFVVTDSTVPFLELGLIMPNFARSEKPDFDSTEKNEENAKKFMSHSLDYVLSLKRPRIIKTHLPLELLPANLLETCKVH